jgi:superfamily II DNA or RNA helicase
MADEAPSWFRDLMGRRRLTGSTAEHVREAMRSGVLSVPQLRLLLLAPLRGALLAALRVEILAWLEGRVQLAPGILSHHAHTTRLPAPELVVRAAASGPDSGCQVQAQARLRVGGVDRVGEWALGISAHDARQRAQLFLLRRLVEAAAPSAASKNGGPDTAGRTARLAAGLTAGPQPSKRPAAPAVAPAEVRPGVQRGPQPAMPGGAEALGRLLDNGWDVIPDADECPSRPHLLVCPPLLECPPSGGAVDSRSRALGSPERVWVDRVVAYPDATRRVSCVRIALDTAVPVLARPAADQWSDSARLWQEVSGAGLGWVASEQVLPTIGDAFEMADRQAGWRLGRLGADDEARLNGWARRLIDLPRCVRTVFGNREQVPPLEVVGEFLDALVMWVVHCPPLAWLLGDQPFISRRSSSTAIDAVQDWVDDLEFDGDGPLPCGLIVRVEGPGDDRHVTSLRAHLRLTRIDGCVDTAVDAAGVWAGDAPPPVTDPRLRLRVGCALRRAGRLFAPLRALGRCHRPGSVLLGLASAGALRGPVGEALQKLGIKVEWEKGWLADLSAHVLVGVQPPTARPDGRLGLPQVLDRRWQLALDGQPLTEAEMTMLAAAAMPLVRLRNRWVLLDEPAQRALTHPDLDPVPRAIGVLDTLLGSRTIDGRSYACSPTDGLADLLRQLRDDAPNPTSNDGTPDDDKAAARADLPGSLRAHQRSAILWLERISRLGLNGLLADEMGTGKTLTALGFQASAGRPFREQPTLVVCPNADMVRQWCHDAARHLPEMAVLPYWGRNRTLPSRLGDTVVVTTFQTLARDADELRTRRWGMVVADEAHKIKNPRTRAARGLRLITSPLRLALTGTPLENDPAELWAILDWLNPDLLNSRHEFAARHVSEFPQGATAEDVEAQRARVQAMLAPLVKRRTKQIPDIARALPPSKTTTHRLPLSQLQCSLLEALFRDTGMQFHASDNTSRSGQVVLGLIEKHKKICNSPAHFLGETPDAVAADPKRAAREAPKLARLGELMADIAARGESALAFTPYARMAELIDAYLRAVGYASSLYHGTLPAVRKRRALEEISSGHAQVLVVTVGSGGTGLDLTRPNHVIHYDRPWNPAQEDQASARVHRFGQRRGVHVHHLVHDNSIEEHILARQHTKRRYANFFLPTGDVDFTKITPHELAALFHLDDRR